MSEEEEHEDEEKEESEKTLFETLKERWFVWLVALVGLVLAILICNWAAQHQELVLGWYEQIFGNGGPTETEEATETEESNTEPPPTDTPTPTDEPTRTEEATGTEEGGVGDGTCNAVCRSNADCLAGLSCLPAPGQTYSVCWNDAICNPTPTEQGPVCGDGVCDTGESPLNCPQDCGLCGNGVCDPGEHVYNCSVDCGEPPLPEPPTPIPCACGNGVCQPACGETPWFCPSDC